ncbi:unnamed protein product [Symbiodinium sp. CCMP2592]|nr:unnamed protein product [Symbiodinium sp. CCMP2592]
MFGPRCQVPLPSASRHPSARRLGPLPLLWRLAVLAVLFMLLETALGTVSWASPIWRGSGASDSAVLLNSTYSNALGSCQVVVWPDGRMEFELHGFGTADTTGKMLRDCRAAMKRIDGSVNCTALVDMRMGLGCSPLAVPVISRFMRDEGPRIQYSAVLGPRPLMALAQTIATAVHQTGVAFFIHRHDAEKWCQIPTRQQRPAGTLLPLAADDTPNACYDDITAEDKAEADKYGKLMGEKALAILSK